MATHTFETHIRNTPQLTMMVIAFILALALVLALSLSRTLSLRSSSILLCCSCGLQTLRIHYAICLWLVAGNNNNNNKIIANMLKIVQDKTEKETEREREKERGGKKVRQQGQHRFSLDKCYFA